MAAAVAPACLLEDCRVVRFDLFLDEPTVRRPVAGGHGELGRALEDREAAGLPGDDRNRLHAAGAGAYDRHAFSRKVDGVVRPGAGVVPVALEGLQPLDPGDVARGYAADAGDEVPGGYPVAVVGLDLPQVGFLPEGGGRDAGVELDVATQVEAVGDVVEVGEDLRLLGVFAAPAPVLEQLLREREAVDVALGVAAGAGIAVPVPGAADAAAGFVDLDGEAHHVPQTPQHPHTREAGSDYYGIEVSAISSSQPSDCLCSSRHLTGSNASAPRSPNVRAMGCPGGWGRLGLAGPVSLGLAEAAHLEIPTGVFLGARERVVVAG